MRNISLINFDIFQLSNINSCEAFCFNCQTLYAYDKGVIIKYNEQKEEVICNLTNTLYQESEALPEAIEITYHYEKDLVYLILSNGDVISIESNGGSEETIVGFVEHGVKAAQWSPEQEVIALVNGVDSVIVLTNDFDPVSEVDLHSSGFGEKEIISVGWGRKETQFHGSIGKYAAQEKQAEVQSENSNDKIRISWRGDAEYFAVSSINPETKFRYIRVFSKNGTLQYTSEKVIGLEDCLDWRPSGSLIASTQQLPNKYNICFFEKNGMKHGDFSLPVNIKNCKVNELLWSKDSRILAATITSSCESSSLDAQNNVPTITERSIQFFTVSNYKWYCKYTINCDKLGVPLCVKWDLQKQNVFHVLFSREKHVYHYKYTWVWATNKSRGGNTNDASFVAVINGCDILLTSFNKGITPPPMCTYAIKTMSPVNSVAFAPDSSNDLLVHLSNGNILIYKYLGDASQHELVGTIDSLNTESESCYSCQWLGFQKLVLCMTQIIEKLSKPFINIIDIKEVSPTIKYDKTEIQMKSTIAFVRASDSGAVFCDTSGKLYLYKNNALSIISAEENPGIIELDVIEKTDGYLFIFTLDSSNKFYVNSKLILNNILSFHVHNQFVLLTSMKHELLCFNSDNYLLNTDVATEVFKRKVERGSRLVTSVQKDMKVVLQMPRGNLECVQPRALSVYTIGKYLDELNYSQAFNLMRKQRINLNLIYDHNPTLFENNVKIFIKQIADPQWISLFISDIIEEDVTKTMYHMSYKEQKNEHTNVRHESKIDILCDLMERALSNFNNSEEYLLPILTCLIKRNKIEFLEAALVILKNLKDKEQQGVRPVVTFDEAFKYVLYLIDVEEIYKIALGMYDFDLVLIVANKSQKDPKEYLPFLNDLKKLETNYQKFTIDKHLKRYKKALKHLIQCEGDAVFNECLAFIRTHQLHKLALKLIPQNTDRYKSVCVSYGEDLMKTHSYEEAGMMFAIAEEYKKAVDAYKKSGNWQEILNCVQELKLTENELNDIYQDLAKGLIECKQFKNAATVHIDYLKNVEDGIKALTNGKFFAEAYRMCNLHNCSQFIDSTVVPGIVQIANETLVQVAEYRDTFVRQSTRLQVVRKKKKEESESKADYDGESDIFSEASTVITKSYASSRGTNRTYRSAKNKRKQERKLLSLKEGSRYEDLALVTALHTLVTNCIAMMSEVREINKFLIKIKKFELAEKLQDDFDKLLKTIDSSKSEIWTSELMQSKPSYGPDATSNEIAANYIQSENMTPTLLNPKYAIPPEAPEKLKWKLEIVKP